jgi:hypothetical protein
MIPGDGATPHAGPQTCTLNLLETIADWLIILATASGPILAVQAQKWIERATERKRAQKQIFYSLMATRVTRVAPDHVRALNMIDLEFSGTGWRRNQREREVVNRWRIYADHLNLDLGDNPPQARLEAWAMQGDELFTDLLVALANALGYPFDRVQLRRGIYRPRAHNEADIRQEVMQRALTDILVGARSFPMRVTEFPVSEELVELQRRVNEGIERALDPEGAVKIKQID